ncbi:MAG: hypothetical protein D6831_02895 [Aquificota bacterium]|nr:MAG: hypothetical protein D6831_02895 [Aquificota bacterium]
MLFRISVSIVLGICITAFGYECKTEKECKFLKKNSSKIESVKKEYKHLKENKNKVQLDKSKLIPNKKILKKAEKYKSLENNKVDVSKYEDMGKAVNWNALLKMYGGNWLEMNKNIRSFVNENDKKKVFIFYLFSTTVPKKTIVNVIKSAKKYKDIKVIPVIRGLNRKGKKPVEKYIWAFMNDINSKVGGGIRVKINPIIFRKAKVNLVPAFVLADCPILGGIIRSKECDYKAVIFGDTSLDFAIEKFKEAGLWSGSK